MRNLARRLDQEAPGVAASILEGLDEMLTVQPPRLVAKLRRSLACTNSIENMMGTVRRVCRNVKRWRNAAMALRWTAAGMMEAAKGFRRLKAYKHLPVLRAALAAHQTSTLNTTLMPKHPGSYRKKIVHLDGPVRDIHVVAHPVLSTSGHLVEFVGTVIDVTERRRAEQERARLRQLEADLAHINRVSTLGEMAASLAHEVKQPIAAARNNARAALNFLDRSPPDLREVREAVDCIVGDADRVSDVVDRIGLSSKKRHPGRRSSTSMRRSWR